MNTTSAEKLAIHGGPKVRETLIVTTGQRFGEAELAQLKEALEQQTLFYWHGNKVKTFCRMFAERYGVPHCHMVTSGTAALHVATMAVGIGPGDEVITSPITDQGTIISILAQGGVPVFADVDPHSYTITGESVAAQVTDKTRAVIVVHLAGNAADMDGILEVARKHDLRVIEDCAQSFLCMYKGKLAGTIGDMGCFSLNDYKHISAGDAGAVITRDGAMSERIALCLDKGYYRDGTGRKPAFLAANYRASELLGAVAIAQLDKLQRICDARRALGERLNAALADVPGIHPHKVHEGCASSFWFYLGRMDPAVLGISRDDFVQAVQAEGVPVTAGYLGQLVYEYPLLTERSAYEGQDFPWDGRYGRKIAYSKGMCPTAELVEATAWRAPVTEFMSERDVDDIAAAVTKVARYFGQTKT